ncbi:MAG: cobalamin-dependent protein [Desulfobaccales bacterium]
MVTLMDARPPAPAPRPAPRLLLVNPWIYDFAAYDFFAAPLGLLTLAGLLLSLGYEVEYLDCLAAPRRPGPFGTGRYPKEILPTPPVVADVPRRYGRYGAPEAQVRSRLEELAPPDAVLVTSLMTYWYPGVAAVIRLVREYFPRAPVLLGGIYASLCPEHARRVSGADVVLPGPGEETLPAALATLGLGPPRPPAPWEEPPWPALHLASGLSFIPLLTSRGCPFACEYCASPRLAGPWRPRAPAAAAAELAYWHRTLGLADVALYDDAFLCRPEEHALAFLEEVARLGLKLRFHTPNALHARFLTPEVARALKRAGFVQPRLGVETAARWEARPDRKLAKEELEAAVAHLVAAGYAPGEIGAYLLLGLPGQEDAEMEASIRTLRRLGVKPILASYSPLPGTPAWPKAVAASRYDLRAEPLCHNNSLFPCWPTFSWERYTRLKRLAQET